MPEEEYTSIRIKKPIRDKARDLKYSDESWGELLLRASEEPPQFTIPEGAELQGIESDSDMAERVAELNEKLDRIERLLEEMAR